MPRRLRDRARLAARRIDHREAYFLLSWRTRTSHDRIRLNPPRHYPRSQRSRRHQYSGSKVDWAADEPRRRLINIDHTGVERNVFERRLSDIQVRRGAR